MKLNKIIPLPKELISKIFSYDNTYHIINRKNMNSLKDFFEQKKIINEIDFDQTEYMNLSNLKLNDTGIKLFFNIIKFLNKEIKYLKLVNNNIGIKGIKLINNQKSIERLDLTNNNLDDESAILLSKNKNIKWLNLSINNISCMGAIYLSKNNYLTHLDLFQNKISDQGIQALSENQNIEVLDLQSNLITNNGLIFMEKNITLKEFYIDDNNKRLNHDIIDKIKVSFNSK